MSNDHLSLIVALPSRAGDPLRLFTTSMSPSKVIPASPRPHHRNTIRFSCLCQWHILYNYNMTTRGTIQRTRVFLTSYIDSLSILLI